MCSFMPPIALTNDSKDAQFDGVIVVVTDSLEHLPTSLQSAQCTIKDYLKVPVVCVSAVTYLLASSRCQSVTSRCIRFLIVDVVMKRQFGNSRLVKILMCLVFIHIIFTDVDGGTVDDEKYGLVSHVDITNYRYTYIIHK